MVRQGDLEGFSAKGIVDAILFVTTRSYCGFGLTLEGTN